MSQRKRLKVFVSSSQKEFSELRQRLRDKLLDIPLFVPIVLELEGARPSTIRETSLKSAQECDIFIGILGSRYSKLVEEEYNQALSNHSPCFIYVKKVKKRSSRIKALIDNEIQPNFKYHEFEDETKVIDQIINDLNGFLLEIMAEGLGVLKQRKRKNLRKQLLMQQMQRAIVSPTEATVLQFLQSANNSYNKRRYVEAVLNAELAIESCLQYVLVRSNVPLKDLSSFGLMLRAATRHGFLTTTNRNLAMEFRRTRNKMVHMAWLPGKKETEASLKSAENIVRSLLDLSRIKTGISIESLKRMSEEEILTVVRQLSFENIQRLVQRILDEVSLISSWKEEVSNENLFKFLKLAIRLRDERIQLFRMLYDCFTKATIKFGREKILSIFAELTRVATIKKWIAEKGNTDIFVSEFEKSSSFEMAGINAEIVLNLLPVLSDEQASRVIESASSNDQMYGSYKARGALREIISRCEKKVEKEKIENLRSKFS